MAGFYTAALSKSQALHWPGLSPPSTLIVCRWPDSYVSLVQDIPGCSMARGRYTTEMFTTADDAEAHSVLLLEQLAGHGELAVRMISAETLAPAGTA